MISRGRIFSHAGNELGASSFPARNELSMLFPYSSFPAGNELVLKLTKNTASGLDQPQKLFYLFLDTKNLHYLKMIFFLPDPAR